MAIDAEDQSETRQVENASEQLTTRQTSLYLRLHIWLDEIIKHSMDQIDELYTDLMESFSTLLARLGYHISVLLAWAVGSGPTWEPQALSRAFFGIAIVGILVVPLLSAVLILGTIATVLGLRNIGEYRLREQIAAWTFGLMLLIFAPFFLTQYAVYKITLIFIFAVGIVGLDFLYGQCGIISMGQGGFLLTGSYLTTWLFNGTFGFHLPILIAIFCGALINGIVGILLGIPALRVKDYYLVIISLAFTVAVPKVMKCQYLANITGLKEGGLYLPKSLPPEFLSFVPVHVWSYFCIVASCSILLYFSYGVLHHSQIGRAFRTIRCDTEISLIFGIPVARYKLLAFVLSGIYAGFAGGFLAMINLFISPDSFTSLTSIDFLVGNIVGGPGGLLGSVLGGAFLTYENDITHFVGGLVPHGNDLAHTSYGLILMLVILFAPRGIAGELSSFLKRKFQPEVRRGSFQVNPPPDYDYLEDRKQYFESK